MTWEQFQRNRNSKRPIVSIYKGFIFSFNQAAISLIETKRVELYFNPEHKMIGFSPSDSKDSFALIKQAKYRTLKAGQFCKHFEIPKSYARKRYLLEKQGQYFAVDLNSPL